MTSSLEVGIDTESLELCTQVEGVVQSGDAVAIILRNVVVLVDDAIFVDILIRTAEQDSGRFPPGSGRSPGR